MYPTCNWEFVDREGGQNQQIWAQQIDWMQFIWRVQPGDYKPQRNQVNPEVHKW